MHVFKAMGLNDIEMLVFAFTKACVNNNSPVMATMDASGIITIFFKASYYSVKLPWSGRACRVKEVPAYINLKRCFFIFRQDILIACKIHQPMIIMQDCGRRCPQNSDS